jgi:hypothetical protein
VCCSVYILGRKVHDNRDDSILFHHFHRMRHVPDISLSEKGHTSSVLQVLQRKHSGWKRDPTAVTIRPAIGLLHIAQSNAAEPLERTWTLGHDLSALGGTSGIRVEDDESEGTLMEGTLIEGMVGAGLDKLMEDTLMEGGVVFESLIERSSMGGIRSSSRGSGCNGLCPLKVELGA